LLRGIKVRGCQEIGIKAVIHALFLRLTDAVAEKEGIAGDAPVTALR